MDFLIRPLQEDDLSAVVQLSLLAWAPVFRSFEQVLGGAIFAITYPDWPASQKAVVEQICRDDENTIVWVAEVAGRVAGFIAWKLDRAEMTGEVELLAVHPEHQNRGIGTALNDWALARMKEAGMRLAVVATGGDPGHAPARRSYEKAGYTPLPLVRYYQAL